ncbi:alpha-ketoacid dehydrogenase subunit beta [Patescibacteria group bacterium]|nr:alpha-ketoacid dehydrogenase subunit beta [Patescibacteria group bacterium]MBU4511783.1 alpha-ketoacid dehydrogenase subunit beta [Patescibacteria group bacterium]MCG2693239.1 alpha-ketoacid dehydrogenase subunit beta [Candidatus Parcubacteria bacterium]
MRKLTYAQAIAEATIQAMQKNPNAYVMGLGVDDPKGIFNTTKPAFQKFGKTKVFDMPLAENSLTGIAIGSALTGMHPLMVHARCDFLFVCADQIINQAAKWRFTYAGTKSIPLTIRAIIGQGWGQGVHHSQSPQAMFAHAPGIKVIMPATAYDAKGLLLSAMEDLNPVLIIEHRRLFDLEDEVPKKYYTIPIGKANIIQKGADLTIIADSIMTRDALIAASVLEKHNISTEVIDLRTIKPLDTQTIIRSIKKTGRIIIADTGWKSFGVTAEIAAVIAENAQPDLKAPIQRIAALDTPTPCSYKLEELFYPSAIDIIKSAKKLFPNKKISLKNMPKSVENKNFTGPF